MVSGIYFSPLSITIRISSISRKHRVNNTFFKRMAMILISLYRKSNTILKTTIILYLITIDIDVTRGPEESRSLWDYLRFLPKLLERFIIRWCVFLSRFISQVPYKIQVTPLHSIHFYYVNQEVHFIPTAPNNLSPDDINFLLINPPKVHLINHCSTVTWSGVYKRVDCSLWDLIPLLLKLFELFILSWCRLEFIP